MPIQYCQRIWLIETGSSVGLAPANTSLRWVGMCLISSRKSLFLVMGAIGLLTIKSSFVLFVLLFSTFSEKRILQYYNLTFARILLLIFDYSSSFLYNFLNSFWILPLFPNIFYSIHSCFLLYVCSWLLL